MKEKLEGRRRRRTGGKGEGGEQERRKKKGKEERRKGEIKLQFLYHFQTSGFFRKSLLCTS